MEQPPPVSGDSLDKAVEAGIILPEDGEDGAIFIDPRVRTLTERSDVDPHSNLTAKDLGEDWGDGFYVAPEHVLVERGPDGGIVRTTPLSEIPGVDLYGAANPEPEQASARPKPVALSREERGKLVDVLTMKLFKYYKNRPKDHPAFNPFRDGIPEVADADPMNLAPGKSEAVLMHPNPSDTEIYMWLRKFVGARASIVDKKQGFNGIGDLALRIERNPD